MSKSSKSLLIGLLLLSRFSVAYAADYDPLPDRLPGTWSLSSSLTEHLNGSSGGAPELVVISAGSGVAALADPEVLQALGGAPVSLAGALTFSSRTFSFLLTSKDGLRRLLCYPPSGDGRKPSLLWLHFAFIPAKDPQNDLLFLGGETATQPFFAYERAKEPEPPLSAETSQLLEELSATESADKAAKAALALPFRPDWQAALDRLSGSIERNPHGLHNNQLVAIEKILNSHLAEASLDLTPVLDLLKDRTWTNQQKAAEVLAVAVRRAELSRGREREIAKELIPLTASQRGPTVQAVLRALHTLTGQQELQRDPMAWALWYERTYGERISLESSISELLGVVRPVWKAGAAQLYSLNGAKPVPLNQLESQAAALMQKARAGGLEASFVVLVPAKVTDQRPDPETLLKVEPLRAALAQVGADHLTVAPEDSQFYPPFELALPSKHP